MIKKIIPWIVIILLFILLIIGFSLKDNMNTYLSKVVQNQTPIEIILLGNALNDSLYNYSENGLSYEITFLEFGAIGCSACKQMQAVMEEVNSKYPIRVNVVFLNVLKLESKNLMKLYGIVAIPTQVLLDKNGKEYFRHTGFYSFEDLNKELDIN